MMKKPHHKGSLAHGTSYEFVLATVDRLNREKADLLEEVRQLRAAVAIYQRIAERVTEDRLTAERKSA